MILVLLTCVWFGHSLQVHPTEHGSLYKNTLLLLQGVRPERMDLMNEVYGKWFGGIKFMVWACEYKREPECVFMPPDINEHAARMPANFSSAHNNYGRQRNELEDEIVADVQDSIEVTRSSHQHSQVVLCNIKYRKFYHARCLSPLLNQMLDSEFTGVLTMHMDFWINPIRLMLGSSLNDIWQLGTAGLSTPDPQRMAGHMCFRNVSRLFAEDSWWWWENSKMKGEKALTQLKKALKENPALLSGTPTDQTWVDDLETCAGWADLYYLPKATWHNFYILSSFYAGVFHESAVPTLLSHLGKASTVSISTKQCGGTCCSDSDISDTAHACGHRFNFTSEGNRVRWKEWMNDLVP